MNPKVWFGLYSNLLLKFLNHTQTFHTTVNRKYKIFAIFSVHLSNIQQRHSKY